MALLREGEQAVIPYRLAVHMVAARYGTTPVRVRDWPADDFSDAVNMLSVTGGASVRRQ